MKVEPVNRIDALLERARQYCLTTFMTLRLYWSTQIVSCLREFRLKVIVLATSILPINEAFGLAGTDLYHRSVAHSCTRNRSHLDVCLDFFIFLDLTPCQTHRITAR